MELPYKRNALIPYMSKKTIDYHYGKHHAGYVDKLNKLIKGTPYENDPLETIIEATYKRKQFSKLYNNAAQVWNHDFFWKSMKPLAKKTSSKVLRKIENHFGTFNDFKQEFIEAARDRFGSGWVWLVLNDDRELEIISTPNAENPLTMVATYPLLVYDVWEHAYYLDYFNVRALAVHDFLEHLVDWEFVERNLDRALNLI